MRECQRNNRSASAASPTVSLISVSSPLHITVIANVHCFIGIRSTYHHRSITVNPLSQLLTIQGTIAVVTARGSTICCV